VKALRSSWFLVLSGIVIIVVILNKILCTPPKTDKPVLNNNTVKNEWKAPDINQLPQTPKGELVRYGRELIANTAKYFGPKGIVAPIINGMNCQNCHIDAGAKPYGNCFSAVASMYPQFRPRSGIIESIGFRINDCMMRSMNGKMIDSNSKEMLAMVAYLKWIGKDVPLKTKPPGAGTEELPFMERAADTLKGRIVYLNKCVTCHGKNGEGIFNADSSGYTYPPLWGQHSYNTGAGIYRLSRFAGYVKYNMPSGAASHNKPVLTNEEAWDVAAFVNSQTRPVKKFPHDWPDITKKAIDFPFGPYADKFSEQQHKYGPFIPIKEESDKQKGKMK
jgi:thiosulfate dehydrogenase